MTATENSSPAGAPPLPDVTFGRAVVGVDGSSESREALRQTQALLDDDARLTLLAAWDVAPTLVGGTGMGIPTYYDEDVLRKAAGDVLESACSDVHGRFARAVRLVRGRPSEELIREAAGDRAALIAVGSHGTGRATGILIGSTATEVVHKAPCSVLVTRPASPSFPREIVVGLDGSPESGAAYAIARRLAERCGAGLRAVVAHGGKGVDAGLVEQVTEGRYDVDPEKPVRALLAAATTADLLVVGSRGLHGFAALGSVSERVAHEAPTSVLVVRHGGD